MARRTEQFDSTLVVLAMDDAPPAADRISALIWLRVVDELTGAAPLVPVALTTELRGCTAREGPDGVCGLVGIARRVFPSLATVGYSVPVRVWALGFVPQSVVVGIGPIANFPDEFAPPPQVVVNLRREPVVISGRVTGLVGGVMTPMAGATVSVTEIWRRTPPASAIGTPEPSTLVSLRPPLYFDRTAATGLLRSRNLSINSPTRWLLTDHVPAGADEVRLSTYQGLATGEILWIDAERAELSEYIRLAPVTPPGTAQEPFDARVQCPLAYGHRRDGVVRRVDYAVQGATNALAHDAVAGDTCVFLSTTNGLAGAQHVMLSDGPLPLEYHDYFAFSVTADAEGYYRLPPISRVGQVRVRAVSGPRSAQPLFCPDYTAHDNRLDIVI